MSNFEKGDQVIMLDRPMGHITKIRGVIVGIVSNTLFNVLLTNGYGKGNIRRVRPYEMKKESEVEEDKKGKILDN